MSNAPFPIDPELTAIAIAYRNGRMIADEVLPRAGRQAGVLLWKYDLAQGFTVPETLVGRKSKPNEAEFSATDETSSTEDHGSTPRCRRRISTTRRRTTTPGPRHRADHQPDPARSRSSDFQAGFQPQQLCRGQQKDTVWHRSSERPASNPLPEITDARTKRHPAPEHRRPAAAPPPSCAVTRRS
ncbi:hypothetical protein P4050_16595 [Pseudomonas aeruginosa]|nr:hypothetical protein [Pseudomonas aeruginosa]